VADPADIVRNLMDPVVFREAPLETVLCVADAAGTVGLDDPLLRSQVQAADVVALSKLDLVDAAERDRVRAAVAAIKPQAIVTEALHGRLPLALLLPVVPDATPRPREVARSRPIADRWETTTWVSDQPLSLPRLQTAIGRMAPRLARAKGLFQAVEHPGRSLLLQFAAGRATVSTAPLSHGHTAGASIVFIAEIGALDAAKIERAMEQCVVR